MSYVDDNLISGEVVQTRAHVSPLLLVPGAVLTVVLFLINHYLAVVGLVLLAAELITLVTTEFAVTNKRIVGKAGLVRRDTLELDLGRIESLSMSQGLIGRILGYGTARVRGTGSTVFAAPGISSPMNFKKAAFEQIEVYKQGATHGGPAPAPRAAASHCTQCGSALKPGDRFCGECGTPAG